MAGAAFVSGTISGTSGSSACQSSYACGCNALGCSVCYTYSSGSIGGTVTSGSSNVFVNTKALAKKGSSTNESLTCSGGATPAGASSGTGSVTSGSAKVFVNGIAVARLNDTISHFSGSGSISSGSTNVIVG